MTCGKKLERQTNPYLRVDIGDTCSLLAVETQVDFGVAEELLSNERLVIGGALVCSCCLLLNLEKEVFLFQA